MQHRSDSTGPGVTAEQLERERLRTYIDWAEVRAPAWYWPAYGCSIGAWIGGYGLGPFWGFAGTMLVVIVAVVGVRVMANRGQVSMPRFRGMPTRLKRAYLPMVASAVWLLGVLLFGFTLEAPPYLWLGVLTGLLMALGGAWTSRLYRVEARRLAKDVGIPR